MNQKDGINPRRRAFIDSYLIERNATEAARQAGYSHPDVQGPRLLGNVRIRTEIEQRINKASAKADISVERTLLELARIAYVDVASFFDASTGKLLPVNAMPEDSRRALSGVKVSADGVVTEVKFGKMSALDLLAKISGLVQSGTNVSLVSVQQHAAASFLGSLSTWADRMDRRALELERDEKPPRDR